MAARSADRVRVGTTEELKERGCSLVSAGGHSIAIFAYEDRFYAVDNRCPHMGFPLSRGTVQDGLLTCHWHHARFDLEGGGTLDPFADNVRAYRTVVEDGQVWLDLTDSARDSSDTHSYWLGRLNEGLEQRLHFVLAKSVLALLAAGAAPTEIVRAGGAYGLRYRGHGWGQGMTILTATAQLLPYLALEDRPLALFHGLVHVSRDTTGQTPRFDLDPLPSTSVPMPRLEAWFRRAVEVRDTDGAERILQTAVVREPGPSALASILLAAATDHFYLDAGHTVDFINKACEYLDLVGWDEASVVLPTVVGGLCRAQRAEELNSWRHPIDLVEVLRPYLDRLPDIPVGSTSLGEEFDQLVWQILDGEPDTIASAITSALECGVAYAEVGQAIAHASALRIARFHTNNEFGDWDTVHNTWTSCQALHQALLRTPSSELARGLYHAAMRIYLDRFLNVPPARLPDEHTRPGSLPIGATSPGELLILLDQQQRVEDAANLVERVLTQNGESSTLIRTLGHTVLREDAEFHNYQTLEAGVRQYESLKVTRPLAARRTLVAVARYLAAHAPTPRELYQTYTIAQRLNRGDDLTLAEG